MCGIHGIISVNLSEKEIKNRLFNMGRLQKHRGPDDRKETVTGFRNKKVGLGFVRLSILDLESGMQPIVCKKDNTAIICNGQVYNYIELKNELSNEPFVTKGDIEVALHMYRKKGIKFLNDLNGMYAGAIYDPRHSKIILFRDRFGIKPLYYTIYKNNLVFSSEIKPLLSGSKLPIRLKEHGPEIFFAYRYLPGENTMFQGVKKLPPGSYLEYHLKSGKHNVNRYWSYHFKKELSDMSIDEAGEQFYSLFSDAVNIRFRSDVEVGCLLSGGIDSSAVASMAALSKPEIKLFTMAFIEKKYNELPLVKQFIEAKKNRFKYAEHFTKLCDKESLEKLPDIINSIEEPISLGTVIPTDQVSELAGEKLKVVLTGEGADEIFGGYRKFLIEMAAFRFESLSKSEQKDLEHLYPELEPYMNSRETDPARRYIQSELLFNNNELKILFDKDIKPVNFPEDAIPELTGNEHPLNAAIAFENRARLPDYVILRLDKLSMRHSLETRTPFLDYRLAEFAATLPVNFKVNPEINKGKFICHHAFYKYSVLDKETAFREKQPFTIPIANWLSKPESLPDFLKEIIFGNVIKQQGILNHDYIGNIVKNVSSDGIVPSTLVSEADKIFAVIIFTLWYEGFFNNNLEL